MSSSDGMLEMSCCRAALLKNELIIITSWLHSVAFPDNDTKLCMIKSKCINTEYVLHDFNCLVCVMVQCREHVKFFREVKHDS